VRIKLSWKKEWTGVLLLFLSLRLIYAAMGVYVALGPEPYRLAREPIFDTTLPLLRHDPLSEKLVNIWFRWDTGWYLKIAAQGYSAQDSSIAYLPLYPLSIRWLASWLGEDYLLSALLVSNLATLVALLLLYELVRGEDASQETATKSILSLLLFPTGFFLFAAYTESIFLACVLGAWLVARKGNWLPAGLLGALATLTRLQGVVLTPVLLWMVLSAGADQHGENPAAQVKVVWKMLTSRESRRRFLQGLKRLTWLGAFLPVLAFMAYSLWVQYAQLGGIQQALESHWSIQTVMPWTGFWKFLVRLFTQPHFFIDWIELSLFLPVMGLLILGFFKLKPVYSLYNWLTLSILFMRGTPPHLLDSFSRYYLSMFPLFILIGRIKNRKMQIVLWSLSFSLQLFLLRGFLDWRWVA
jgi:hypothetical protein